jgi:hypothetical protein
MAAQLRKRGRPRQDACKNGHPLSGDNLYVAPSGERQCCTCRNAAKRAVTARRAAAKENAIDP